MSLPTEALEAQLQVGKKFSELYRVPARWNHAVQGAMWQAGNPTSADLTSWGMKALLVATARGDTYQWEAGPIDLVTATTLSVPDFPLGMNDLPSRYGWFWFTKPLALPLLNVGENRVEDRPLRAIAFATVDGDREVAVLFLTELPLQPAGVAMTSAVSWFFGNTLADRFAMLDTMEMEGPSIRPREELKLRYFQTALAFLQQRLASVVARTPDRGTRRRLQREGWEHVPDVQIVELRHKERVNKDISGDPREIKWSCQWLVREHWRRQWYPSQSQYRPRLVSPHIKGPEDKPLKMPRATVFQVKR